MSLLLLFRPLAAGGSDTPLAVTAATFQPDGQAIPLNIGLVVSQASFQIDGQTITLTPTDLKVLDVQQASFSILGQDIGLLATGIVETNTGGWIEYFRWEQREMARRDVREKERKELEEEADRLERHLIEEGSISGPDPEIRRVQQLADAQREKLSNRARRALEYAEKVRTLQAYELLKKELERLQDEEDLAVLMLLTLD